MKELLTSKKFIAAVVGIIVVIVVNLIPAIDEVTATAFIQPVVTLIVAYIAGQGLADFGKYQGK